VAFAQKLERICILPFFCLPLLHSGEPFLLELQPSSVVTGVKKKKKLGRLKMILPFLLKMLPWTFRFLRQIFALQPGYYL
jgi:hypothetical protein